MLMKTQKAHIPSTLGNYAPYRAYKPSGVEWLGDVPAHWKVWRLKHWVKVNNAVLPETTDPDFEFGYIDIGSVDTGVLTEQPQRLQFTASPSRARRIVRSGDTIVSTVRTYLKAVWFAKNINGNTVCSTGFAVLTPNSNTLPKFVSYMAQGSTFTDRVSANSVGVVYPAIAESRLSSFRVGVPPLPEQAAIVRYLDYVDRRIRRYVGAKRKLIALLEEERQAVVSRAVTRGLDPNVALKPSGVEWLGDVPEHWEVTRVKTEFLCWNRRRIPLSAVERGAMSVCQYDYYGASGMIDRVEDYLFNDELLLIAEDGANLVLRNLPLAIIARGKFWVNNHAHILKPRRGNLEYLSAVMEGMNYIPWISGAAQPKLTQDRLMSISIAVPPRFEQDEVIACTKTQTSGLDAAIARARRQIELVQEYRTKLIADVVTGKLDVRSAAALLPDEDGGQDPIGESGPFGEGLNGATHDTEGLIEDLAIESEVTV